MEAIKLQSMTDFVLEQNKDGLSHTRYSYQKCFNYAKFLKQPLQLGFFVPCDENNNVLKEPSVKDFLYHGKKLNHIDFSAETEQYQKAKERVLFEGFEVKSSKIHEDREFIGWEIYNPSIFINIGNGWQKPEFPDFEIIEDLLSFSKEVELTDSAIKQIGL